MILTFLQVVGTALLVTYAAIWCRQQMTRRRRSWNQIVARLNNHDWGIEEIAEGYLYKSGIRATTEDIWPRIAGCRGLWSMYMNAPVLVELADYAAKHGEGIDRALLENLRRDAFHIRLFVLMALAQHALSASSTGASINAHHAAATYSGMLAHLTQFMQEHSAKLFPDYLDAVA